MGIKNRTMTDKKRGLRRCVCVLMLAMSLLSEPAYAASVTPSDVSDTVAEPQGLYALSACLMDADSGRVLYERSGYEHRANASTTKILTLILTLERAELSDTVTVSERAARQPKVRLGMREGERYRLEDLCYSLMLESHNDSAVAIAEHVGGSVEGFAALMNEKAGELGCTDSYFLTPNGLDEQDDTGIHGTSAVDLSRIMSYCVLRSPQSERFLSITQTAEHTFTDLDGDHTVSCRNHNALLQMMDGALTGKTGFTADAGYCYVGALEQDGRTFVVALLGCGWPNHKDYKWSDCRTLFTYGLENYTWRAAERSGGTCQRTVADGAAASGDPYEKAVVTLTEEAHEPVGLLLRSDETIERTEEIPEELRAPVQGGQECGSVRYELVGADGERQLLYRAGIYAQEAVEKKDPAFFLRYLMKRIF